MRFHTQECQECGATAFEVPDENGRTWCASCGTEAPGPVALDDDDPEDEDDAETAQARARKQRRGSSRLTPRDEREFSYTHEDDELW